MAQRIESVRTLAGRQVTLTVTGICNTGSIVITPVLTQQFGTGGSTLVATTLPTLTLTGTESSQSVTVNVPSIAGKTIGSGGDDYLQLNLNLPTGTTFTFALVGVQLEEGSATPFENRPPQMEYALCQRYRVVYSSATQGAIASGVASNASQGVFPVILPSKMRASPVLSSNNLFVGGLAGTSSTLSFFSGNSVLITVGVSGAPLTTGQALILYAGNGGSGNLVLTDPVL
jgi:hypothetical protein